MKKNIYVNVILHGSHETPKNDESSSSSNKNISEILALKFKKIDDISAITSNLHPLYLQNINHLGLVLISKKLKDIENFGPRKRSLTKNKLELINDSLLKPDDDSLFRAQRDRFNDMMITWILNTISEDISN